MYLGALTRPQLRSLLLTAPHLPTFGISLPPLVVPQGILSRRTSPSDPRTVAATATTMEAWSEREG